ncbi:6-phosphofructokinase 2 [Sphingomonas naasensis]|uniref:Phosphofructokinase n=1 Tax=Sphingomonas naasensis TaxID=1344951 RepID=A0A4S1WLG8_9SPHN|nr:1-phosphofructokinase family hexose kinase [Sphingomonas naasensis]NIJ20881.1 6-phosphofructokinase 2 [Sphingomonas naasensis]TGX43275.1 1-phosphofructokinase family hexose kinase [Sphingomonas naasensis]
MTKIATLTLNPALDVSTRTDKVRPTHKLRCEDPRYEPGGGGINVARVVHALGGDVTAVFPCGAGSGATFEKLLRDTGVPIAPVPIAGATRESFTVDETESDQQYRFVLPGPTLAAAELDQLLHAVTRIDPAPGYVVASGSLPPGCDPSVFHTLCGLCGEVGARLVIDTSGPALAALEGGCAWLIKPSLRELQELVGRELDGDAEQLAAASELRDRGFAEVVVVSLGERGALLVAEGTELRMPAIEVPPGSAVGAGDSMVAGLTLALAAEKRLEDVLRYGIAAGAAALLTPGTELTRREDVERLYSAACSSGAAQNRS